MSKRDQIRMKAIQKRQKEIDELKKKIQIMTERIEELEYDNQTTLKRMGTN